MMKLVVPSWILRKNCWQLNNKNKKQNKMNIEFFLNYIIVCQVHTSMKMPEKQQDMLTLKMLTEKTKR